jgi:hypothetical protein
MVRTVEDCHHHLLRNGKLLILSRYKNKKGLTVAVSGFSSFSSSPTFKQHELSNPVVSELFPISYRHQGQVMDL